MEDYQQPNGEKLAQNVSLAAPKLTTSVFSQMFSQFRGASHFKPIPNANNSTKGVIEVVGVVKPNVLALSK